MQFRSRTLRLTSVILATALLSSCAKKHGYSDDFASFRGQSDATIFHTGENYLANGKYNEATKQFEALGAIYPFGEYSQQGQIDQIYSYYKANDMAEAAATAEAYINLYPQGNGIAYAYYMRGLSDLQQEGTWLSRKFGVSPAPRDTSFLRSAYSDMSVVATLYPNSGYANSARWFLAAIRNTLAAHEMTVIRYYYDRHAYLAAANRAGYVVRNFQGSNQTIPALAVMYLSYKDLGLNQQANDAWRVLQLNAPGVANRFIKQPSYTVKNKKYLTQKSA